MTGRAEQNDEGMYLIPIGQICRRPPTLCPAGATVRDASTLMQQANVTCVVVTEENIPKGIFTVRDLRRIVSETDIKPSELLLGECMTNALVSLPEDACLFDAISLMARNGFHRVGVVDAAGNLVGMLTDNHLLTFQTSTPLYLANEIEAAVSIKQLKELSFRILTMINLAYRAEVAVRGVVQLISHFNDALTLKLIRLLESEEGITLPPGAAYIVMGSEGRGEQTLRTDQDSAIAYRDGIAAEELMEARRFAERVVFALAEIGVPLCPGNMMANNPEWFHSLTEWRRMISDWVSNSGPEETMRFGVFQDLRVIHGERSFENSIRNHIADSVRSNALFLRNLASDILRFEPPLGLFSRLLVERKGGNRGKLDLKKGGLFVLTRGVALLALEIGVVGGTTWSRIEQLRQANQFSAGDLDEIEDAFTFLTRLRLEKQLESHVNGTEPGNHIDPLTLSDRDRIHLRQSFKTVAMFLRLLKSHYNLDIIAP